MDIDMFKILVLVMVVLLSGCNDHDNDNVDFSLKDVSYSVITPDDKSLPSVATVNYTINVDAEKNKDVTVDFYLLPVDESVDIRKKTRDSSSDDSAAIPLTEDSYFLIYREVISQLPVGSHQRSIQIELPKDVNKGKYEIIPVIDPLNEYVDTNPEDNVPQGIAVSEPSESSIDEESLDNVENSSFISVIDIPEPIDEGVIKISESEFSEPALLLIQPYFTDEEFSEEPQKKYISGIFSLNSDIELTGKYYLIASVTLWGDSFPLPLWNPKSNTYDKFQEINLQAVKETQITYDLEISDEMNQMLIEYVQEYVGESDEPYNTEFTLKLISEADFNNDTNMCDSPECVAEDPDSSGEINKFTPLVSIINIPTYIKMETESRTKKATSPKISWDKNFGNKKKVQAKIFVKGEVKSNVSSLKSDPDKVAVGATVSTGVDVLIFKAENKVITLNAELGLTGNHDFKKTLKVNVLDNTIFSLGEEESGSLGACTDASPCEEPDEGFKKSWEITHETGKVGFNIGPVPIAFKAGFTGELAFAPTIGFDGEAYIGGNLVTANLDAYGMGGVDLKAVYWGIIANLTILDTTVKGRFYATLWDENWNIDPHAGVKSSIDLESINGKFGGFAEVTSIKWCRKKVWHRHYKYPCGKKDKRYTLWFAKTPTLFTLDDYKIFDKAWYF
jgi:hypothetical protein